MANKNNLVLFLGAGASTPFGKPTTKQLKDILVEKYGKEARNSFLTGLLSYDSFPDVEYILAAALEIRDFLNKTHGGESFRYLSNISGIFLYRDNLLNNYVPFKDFIQEWDKVVEILEDEIFINYRWNDEYNSQVENIYGKLISYLDDVSNEIVIATTNYDRAIENFCENERYRYIDGFKNVNGSYRWVDDFYYPQKESDKKDIILYKLHGSLDWKRRRDNTIRKTGEEGRPTDINFPSNLVIYPTLSPKHVHNNKILQIIYEEFKKKIENADICIVIGFSFRDNYLNNIFKKFLEDGKRMIVISPTAAKDIYRSILERDNTNIPNVRSSLKSFIDVEKKICYVENYFKNEETENIIEAIRSYIPVSQ